MIEFIKENLALILGIISLVSIIINILVLIIKKIPLKKILKVISLVPGLVSQAEKLFLTSGNGQYKKDVVISLYNDLLNKYGISKYSKFIDINGFIEEILKAPTLSERSEDDEK